MNYIKEINAFHTHQETNPLTTAAAHLWFVLMDVNNRARWKKQFTVAASLLTIKAALTEGTFKRARNELQDKGYIRFTPQGANRAAAYEMISLVQFSEDYLDNDTCKPNESFDEQENKSPDSTDGNVNHTIDHSVDCTVDPLFKLNETKQKKTKPATSDALAFFQENFNTESSYVDKDIYDWLNKTSEQLVLHAMKLTLDRGKNNWGYVKGILQSWDKKGITTVEKAKAEEQTFQRDRQSSREKRSHGQIYSRDSKSANILPDWFAEHKRQQKLDREEKEHEALKCDSAEMLAEVKRRISAYRNS